MWDSHITRSTYSSFSIPNQRIHKKEPKKMFVKNKSKFEKFKNGNGAVIFGLWKADDVNGDKIDPTI